MSNCVTVLIVWKGGASRITLTDPETVGVIIGVGAAVALIVTLFFLPWLYRKLVKNDWNLRWYHVFVGPLLLRRPDVDGDLEGHKTVQNYYRGHKTLEELRIARGVAEAPSSVGAESAEPKEATNVSHPLGETPADKLEDQSTPDGTLSPVEHSTAPEHVSIIGPRPAGPLHSPAVLFWQFKRFFFRGVDKDIVSLQGKRNILTGDLELMHAHAAHYDNKAEYMYSFLQVMTASAASFTHGANDVSK
jgi:sodium-dependent phosphate transporter